MAIRRNESQSGEEKPLRYKKKGKGSQSLQMRSISERLPGGAITPIKKKPVKASPSNRKREGNGGEQ